MTRRFTLFLVSTLAVVLLAAAPLRTRHGGPHHPDQRRGRQRARDRSRDQQGGGRSSTTSRSSTASPRRPTARRIYLSNESLHTLDIVDGKTLKVIKRIHLSGRPNNVAVTNDGRKVYVGIAQAPGALDVIDTVKMENVKTVPVEGSIHNVYVTPDGKFAVAGSIPKSTISIVDTATDKMVRTIPMSAGIRPMTFDKNPDGSTRNIYVQLSNFHGFAVVDFKTGKETQRIEHPPVPGEHAHTDGLQGAPAHGLGVSPDGKTLWSTSKVYSHAYVFSLPDIKPIGTVFVGQHPEWVTFTPDSKFVYIGAAGDNMTYAVNVQTLKEVARIPGRPGAEAHRHRRAADGLT